MSYEVINRELMIEACNIEDLKLKQVKSFLKIWNDNSTINDLIFFAKKNGSVVLNKNNRNYKQNKIFVEEYLRSGNEALKEMLSEPMKESAEILDRVINLRKYTEKLNVLRYTCAEKEKLDTIDAITCRYGNGLIGQINIYNYGVIEGIRMERAKRKNTAKTK